jgi:hypothetical protein
MPPCEVHSVRVTPTVIPAAKLVNMRRMVSYPRPTLAFAGRRLRAPQRVLGRFEYEEKQAWR